MSPGSGVQSRWGAQMPTSRWHGCVFAVGKWWRSEFYVNSQLRGPLRRPTKCSPARRGVSEGGRNSGPGSGAPRGGDRAPSAGRRAESRTERGLEWGPGCGPPGAGAPGVSVCRDSLSRPPERRRCLSSLWARPWVHLVISHSPRDRSAPAHWSAHPLTLLKVIEALRVLLLTWAVYVHVFC